MWQHRRLYHEDHGATLKHKSGKSIVTLSLLSFSLIFLGGLLWPLFFIWALFFFFCLLFSSFLFFVRSPIPTCGGIIVFIILPHLGQCSNNEDHHTFIDLLPNYNSTLRTKYDSIWMPPAVYRDMQWIKSDMYENYERWLCHKYDVNYMIMQRAIWQWWSVS
mgnify:CR=1 FL=1